MNIFTPVDLVKNDAVTNNRDMNEPEKEKLTSSCQTKVTLSLLILFFNVQKVSDEGTMRER